MSAVPWLWPTAALPRGLDLLARESGIAPAGEVWDPPPLSAPGSARQLERRLQAVAESRRLEVQSVLGDYGSLADTLRRMGPAMLRLPLAPESEARDPSARPWADSPWVLILAADGPRLPWRSGRIRLLGTGGETHSVSVDELVSRLRRPVDRGHRADTDALLQRVGVPAGRRQRALEAMLARRFAEHPLYLGLLLRSGPGTPMGRRQRRLGLGKRLTSLCCLHAGQYLLWLLSWWLIGRAALAGSPAGGWMTAWVLLLLTLIPLRMGGAWLMGRLSIDVGAEVKSRLLQGALSLDRDALRSEGAGRALGRVIEAEALETLAMTGGLTVLTALVELPFALWVLSQGVGGASLPLVAIVTLGLTAFWALSLHRAMARWTDERLRMTHGLVEKMIGHGTRLVQEGNGQGRDEEDQELASYLERLRSMDHRWIRLLLVPRVWLPAALLALAPGFVALNAPAGSSAMAVAVGGVLLFQGVLASLTAGCMTLVTAWISGRRVLPLWRAADHNEPAGLPQLALEVEDDGVSACEPRETEVAEDPDGGELMRASGLTFGFPARGRPVIEQCGLRVAEGDRILLEGPSGGGKSTLASLLAGLRRPQAGSLHWRGLDHASLGPAAWRRRVLLVPQFHDNHVLTETFAFNLLLGRPWPASPADLRRAEEVCVELGLGDLLRRMPSGLHQMVGETGWRLSHGERGRLFLARALLQEADLLLLDESFAALDPDNLTLAMDCARRRANTLIVIAHP